MKKKLFIIMIFFSLVVCSFSSVAAKKRRIKSKTPKRVTIEFGDELIKGNTQSPSIFHLFHKKQLDYNRLIKMRKNFLPEMRRTVREI